ncbi:hypothetical protein, partial [Paracoccus yeei]|uniref:hypothetical protein n=1 Tax=Paracoccus yeei TaxID=147645 RepID=UPI000B69AEAF
MTSETLAEPHGAICMPRAGDADADTGTRRMEPVSFSLIEFGGERLVFRLVDARGELLNLLLNPAVAGTVLDSIAWSKSLPAQESGSSAWRRTGWMTLEHSHGWLTRLRPVEAWLHLLLGAWRMRGVCIPPFAPQPGALLDR